MTLYAEIEKLSDATLQELVFKAGANLRRPAPNAPFVLRREVDGTFSCIFGRYLDEEFHRQSTGEKDGARAFAIAALKAVFWNHMTPGHEVNFAAGPNTARGFVKCLLPGKLKEPMAIRIDVGEVQWRVPPEAVQTTLEEMIGIKV